MRQVLIRTAVKGVITLVGILLISTGLQFMIWLRGPEFVDLMMAQISVAGSPEQARNYFFRELGLDRPFVPDLWPFDNESLWHNTNRHPDETL